MKNVHVVKKWAVASWIFLGFLYSCQSVFAEQSYSFDSLFPKTWYTKARESCMQVWSACDELRNHARVSPINKSIIIDAAIGRLVFADLCLDLLRGVTVMPQQSVSCADMIQFEHILHAIDESVGKIQNLIDVDRGYCLKRVMDGLKKKTVDFVSECTTEDQ